MIETTPLMKQYLSVKERYQDAILLFRLGDFYEMFGEDAKAAAKILQIALTTRDKSKDDPVPMCGIPHFAAETYIAKLIGAGCKVAICEQLEDPKEARGIVKRDVVKVVTPGTYTPDNPKENSYLISIFPEGKRHGIALADISTGEFMVYESERPVEDELSRFEPREVLHPSSLRNDIHYREIFGNYYTSPLDDWLYDYLEAYRTLLEHFRVSTLEGYGCDRMNAAIAAAGALVHYVEHTQRETVQFKKIYPLREGMFMFLDGVTQKNLELIRNLRGGSDGTLLSVLDETHTPMGGRFLRNAIMRPLIDMESISRRLDAVESLINDYELIEILRNELKKVQDLERLASRVSSRTATPRDLAAINASISVLPAVRSALMKSENQYLRSIGEEVADLTLLHEMIAASIVDDPPLSAREGGIIREGYSGEVDHQRTISTSGKDFIAEIEALERQKTGIASLKVGYNRVFGYYIEVTKPNLDLVPEHFIRKQTLVGSERFTTPELKEYESRVISSEEHLRNLEYRVFQDILEKTQKEHEGLVATSEAIGKADFLVSLAIAARRHNYVKPLVDEGLKIEITDGRHPVLERILSEQFIPNNTCMDQEEERLLIITGPNMAGKSTYMRQVALIVLMAQTGSFVPAGEARIGIVDRVFTRIGASDFIAKGQSTFMVEMIETANILNNATERSLILMDEIGRGTSTFDGISIAWAVTEHISQAIKARTLFATHYNELTGLGMALDGVRNYNVSVKEWGEEVIFLRKIMRGPADKSYGIQVARLAGLPVEVLDRAREVLTDLEAGEMGKKVKGHLITKGVPEGYGQMDLFESTAEPVALDLLRIDMSKITPRAAISTLRSLREKAESYYR
jgi:DNA mismatch repair protein MutS